LSPIDVQIKVFDNYITFYNPGKLYGDLTIKDLQTNTYQAAARNKLIAEAFYLTGDIEKYGSGFRRIRSEIRQYPTMKLECAEIPNGFLATISYTERKTSLKNVEKGTEKGTEKITKNQQLILDAITQNPHITIESLTTIVGIVSSKIKDNLSKLKKNNFIERVGAPKGGYWKVIEK
jgi:ATP-dependent DNA helicase RecG